MSANLESHLSEYEGVKKLPALKNVYAGVHQLIVTAGLFVGLDMYGYAWRYCYEHRRDALKALEEWDGDGDPPGPWIKLKGHPDGDRLGPGATSKG